MKMKNRSAAMLPACHKRRRGGGGIQTATPDIKGLAELPDGSRHILRSADVGAHGDDHGERLVVRPAAGQTAAAVGGMANGPRLLDLHLHPLARRKAKSEPGDVICNGFDEVILLLGDGSKDGLAEAPQVDTAFDAVHVDAWGHLIVRVDADQHVLKCFNLMGTEADVESHLKIVQRRNRDRGGRHVCDLVGRGGDMPLKEGGGRSRFRRPSAVIFTIKVGTGVASGGAINSPCTEVPGNNMQSNVQLAVQARRKLRTCCGKQSRTSYVRPQCETTPSGAMLHCFLAADRIE